MWKLAIRDLDTGQFLNNGQWTRDARLAEHFENEAAALSALELHDIKNAELVTLNERGQVTAGKPLRISN